MKCNNCGYCQIHSQCECKMCEDIIGEWEPEFIQECGNGEIEDDPNYEE